MTALVHPETEMQTHRFLRLATRWGSLVTVTLLCFFYASLLVKNATYLTTPFIWAALATGTVLWVAITRGAITAGLLSSLSMWTVIEWFNRHGELGLGATVFATVLTVRCFLNPNRIGAGGIFLLVVVSLSFVRDLLGPLEVLRGHDTLVALVLYLGLEQYFKKYEISTAANKNFLTILFVSTLIALSFTLVWKHEEVLDLLGRRPHVVYSELYGSLVLLSLTVLTFLISNWKFHKKLINLGLGSLILIVLYNIPTPTLTLQWLWDVPQLSVSQLSHSQLLLGLGTEWREWIREVAPIGARYMELQYPLGSGVQFFLQYGVLGSGALLFFILSLGRSCASKWHLVSLTLLFSYWLIFPCSLSSLLLALLVIRTKRKNSRELAPNCRVGTVLYRSFLGVAICLTLWIVVEIGIATIRFMEEPRVARPLLATPLPHHLVLQLIVAEDILFFNHPGIDPVQAKQALERTVGSGKLGRGGSTITMQLAKMAFLSYEKTISRKIRQLWIALLLELNYSKGEILQWYLGTLQFAAPTKLGLSAAAQHYFEKSPNALSKRESLALVLSIEDPHFYNPGVTPLPKKVRQRRRLIEARMLFWEKFLMTILPKDYAKE